MFFRKKKKSNQVSVSLNYKVIDSQTLATTRFEGWFEKDVADRQDSAYRQLLKEAYSGNVRRDLQIAADMIRATEIVNPTVLEVGCGSGYYFEILSYLLGYNLLYTGVDNSNAMIRLAVGKYPSRPFVLGDATRLPFAEKSFDIVFNGVSLMHIASYEAAISEARRTARSWCIFHTVPILQDHPTTLLQKNIYGGGVAIEYTFNEQEFLTLLAKNGLQLTRSVESISYNLEHVLGEKTTTRTYLCRNTF